MLPNTNGFLTLTNNPIADNEVNLNVTFSSIREMLVQRCISPTFPSSRRRDRGDDLTITNPMLTNGILTASSGTGTGTAFAVINGNDWATVNEQSSRWTEYN